MTRDERLSEICAVQTDFSASTPDVYRIFATEDTDAFFEAIHRGLSLVSMQAAFTVAERLTCFSPESALPYRRVLWTYVTGDAQGGVTLDPAPYSVLGAKASVSPTTDWLTASSGAYNRTTGRLTGVGLGVGAWIPEMLFPNPWIWHHLARPLGLSEADIPQAYPPDHVPHFLQVVREGIRGGTARRTLRNLLSAAVGNPFAYATGVVKTIAAGVLTIELPDGALVAHALPAASGALALLSVGTLVRRYNPLVTGGVSVTASGYGEQAWGSPVDVLSAQKDQVTLSSPLACGFGDRVRIRVLSTGFDNVYLVRASFGAAVVVEGAVPALSGGEDAVAQVLQASPAGTKQLTIAATRYGTSGPAATSVSALLDRALPPTLAHTLAIT